MCTASQRWGSSNHEALQRSLEWAATQNILQYSGQAARCTCTAAAQSHLHHVCLTVVCVYVASCMSMSTSTHLGLTCEANLASDHCLARHAARVLVPGCTRDVGVLHFPRPAVSLSAPCRMSEASSRHRQTGKPPLLCCPSFHVAHKHWAFGARAEHHNDARHWCSG
jgi:hypothetical protein